MRTPLRALLLPVVATALLALLAGCTGSQKDTVDDARQSYDDALGSGTSEAPVDEGGSGTDCVGDAPTDHTRGHIKCTQGDGVFTYDVECDTPAGAQNPAILGISPYYGSSGTSSSLLVKDAAGETVYELENLNYPDGMTYSQQVSPSTAYAFTIELQGWKGTVEVFLTCSTS